MATSLSCPNCHEANNVAKVEAVLQNEPHYVSSPPYGAWNDSPLLTLLARPAQPELEPEDGGSGAVVLAGAGGFFGAVLLLYGVTYLLYLSPATTATYTAIVTAWAVPLAFGLMAFVVICAVVAASIVARANRGKVAARVATIHARNLAKTEAWRSATERWNRSWYCRRCGSVYIPGESRAVPAKQMANLLYRM
jgi:hypothetical protein